MLKGVLWSSFLVAILVPPFPFFYARHSMGAGHPTPPVAKSLMPASSLSAHILFIIHHYSFSYIYISFNFERGGGSLQLYTVKCRDDFVRLNYNVWGIYEPVDRAITTL